MLMLRPARRQDGPAEELSITTIREAASADPTLLQIPSPSRDGSRALSPMSYRVPQSPPNFLGNPLFARLSTFVCNVRRLQAVRLLTEGL